MHLAAMQASQMRWSALQKLAVAQLADELAISNLYRSSDGDVAWPAFQCPAFERAVVDVHLLRSLRNRPSEFRIVDDQVGIATQRDRALAWEQSE